jgi:cell division septation protein DedD
MTQDDKPAPAVVDEERAVIECVPPSPPRPADSKPARKPRAGAPDPFAVGVRVLKMAPAWLLFTTVCCSSLVLLLGWVRAGGDAAAVTLPSKHNDARPAKRVSAADETPAASDAPAQAAAQAAPAQTAQPAPAKAEVKAQEDVPAPGGDPGAKFTTQVGSHSDRSEANEQVSRLRAAGFDARSVAAELPGHGTWYRVQVGRFADRGGAAKTIAALRAKGVASAIVVPLQN